MEAGNGNALKHERTRMSGMFAKRQGTKCLHDSITEFLYDDIT